MLCKLLVVLCIELIVLFVSYLLYIWFGISFVVTDPYKYPLDKIL